LPFSLADPEGPLPDDLDTLIVAGGGTLIDRAKAAARDRRPPVRPPVRLVAIPSIFGSGAEASPVVVLDRDGQKEIRLDPKYLPDCRVTWPGLAASIPPRRAREACGDCWAHALEGFLSPLADDALRGELAELMGEMLGLPLAADPRWFEPSARACAGQARASAGLVHGIAHTLEGPLRAAWPDDGWHHARLCTTLLWPVMQFNADGSETFNRLMNEYELDEPVIFNVLHDLFDPETYAEMLPVLAERWRNVLRDPCTRTNSVLVRPPAIDRFQPGVYV